MKKVVSGNVSFETDNDKMDWAKAGAIVDYLDWKLEKNRDYFTELCTDYLLYGSCIIDESRIK